MQKILQDRVRSDHQLGGSRTAACQYQKDSVVVVQAPHGDITCPPPFGGFSASSNWEENTKIDPELTRKTLNPF